MLVTTCFVTWSAITAASATAARPAHCQAPAPSERSATDTGSSPFVVDPTRTSAVSFGAPSTAGAGRRCRDAPTGSRTGAPRRSARRRPRTRRSCRRRCAAARRRSRSRVFWAPSSRPSSSSRSYVAVAMSARWLSSPRPAISPSSSSMLPAFSFSRKATASRSRARSASRSFLYSLVSVLVISSPFPRRSPQETPLDLVVADSRQRDRLVPRRVPGNDLDVCRAEAPACPRAAERRPRSPCRPRAPAATRTFQAAP